MSSHPPIGCSGDLHTPHGPQTPVPEYVPTKRLTLGHPMSSIGLSSLREMVAVPPSLNAQSPPQHTIFPELEVLPEPESEPELGSVPLPPVVVPSVGLVPDPPVVVPSVGLVPDPPVVVPSVGLVPDPPVVVPSVGLVPDPPVVVPAVGLVPLPPVVEAGVLHGGRLGGDPAGAGGIGKISTRLKRSS